MLEREKKEEINKIFQVIKWTDETSGSVNKLMLRKEKRNWNKKNFWKKEWRKEILLSIDSKSIFKVNSNVIRGFFYLFCLFRWSLFLDCMYQSYLLYNTPKEERKKKEYFFQNWINTINYPWSTYSSIATFNWLMTRKPNDASMPFILLFYSRCNRIFIVTM